MNLQHLIGQHMLIGISGHSLTAEEKKFIIENNISGVVLFGRNVSTPEQVHTLCTEIQNLRHQLPYKTPLYIGIDMEGGRVHRLKKPFTHWPALKLIGDLDAPTVAYDFAFAMGSELRAVGINLDFAPCLDIYTNPLNTVIGDRSIGTNAEIVEKMSSALIRGYMKSQIITCGKHFPGHGNTLIDSHEELPIEEATLERLQSVELIPFKKAIHSRVDMMMSAHILYKNIDAEWPATLSDKFLNQLLKKELNFKGLVITDDLDMKAMAKYHKKSFIPVRALQAGADLLLYCNEPDSPPAAIEGITEAIAQGQLNKEQLEISYNKIIEMKKQKLANVEAMPLEQVLQIVGCDKHLELAEKIRQQKI